MFGPSPSCPGLEASAPQQGGSETGPQSNTRGSLRPSGCVLGGRAHRYTSPLHRRDFHKRESGGIWAAYRSNREDITPLATFGTALGVIIGAAIALVRHFAQTEADRQRRIVESFSKAVEQLGSDKLEVRVGAIFALERLSRESRGDYWTIMEVLAAFVRERMRYTTIMARLSERAYFLWSQAGRPEGRSEEFWTEAVRLERLEDPPTDIVAILTVIRRRSDKSRQLEVDRKWLF